MILEGILLILSLILLHYYLNRPKGLPPGPWIIPFLGSGIVMDYAKAKKYQEKYGDIFRTEIGGVKIMYICDFKQMKESMNKLEFADRPQFKGFHFLTDGKEAGVIMSNGHRWTNLRRFLLRNLRDLGMGKSSLDTAIIEEAEFLVEDFKKFAGKPTTFPNSLNIAVLNIVWQMVASIRYDFYDQEVVEFIQILKSLQDDAGLFAFLEFVPILKKILPQFVQDKYFGLAALQKTVQSAKKIFGGTLERRKAEMDPSHAENVIDEYLIQMKDQTEIAQYFEDDDLMKTVADLFMAGYDTTSNMLRWMILYAAKYPEVQQRVQEQIDEVVPKGEVPANHHKAQLPLVEAFIHEVLRCSSLIFFSVIHSASKDTYIGRYSVPKDTIVFYITGMVHQDPRYWDDPQEFKIDRFLDDEGRFVSHREGFAPFGLGKRSCLGESLARMELSIFTATLLQNFTFSPPEGKTIDLTPDNVPMNHFCKRQEFVMIVRE